MHKVSNISCPTCGKTEGLYRLDDCRWGYCKTHRTKWIAETIDDDNAYDEKEGRRRYTEIGLGTFTYVGPDVERYKAILRKHVGPDVERYKAILRKQSK